MRIPSSQPQGLDRLGQAAPAERAAANEATAGAVAKEGTIQRGQAAVGSPGRMGVQRQLLQNTQAVGAAGSIGLDDGGAAGKHEKLRAAFESLPGAAAPSSTYRLDKNVEAYASRWKTLEGATRSFDTTYFIWEDDIFGYAFLGQMLKKAKEGVAIRGMIDATGDAAGGKDFTGLKGEDYLQELVTVDPERVQFGVFNPLFKKDLTSFRAMIASNHDKLAIADGRSVETGGRNMASEYFSDPGDKKGVFRDTDIHVDSPVIARQAKKAFDAEFKGDHLSRVKPERFGNWVKRDIELLGAQAMMDRWLKAPPFTESEIASIRGADQAPKEMVDRVVEQAVKDLPGLGIDRTPNDRERKKLRELAGELVKNPSLRGTYKAEHERFQGEVRTLDKVSATSEGAQEIAGGLASLIANAEESIYIHNPYVVLTEDAINALSEAGKRGVEIVFGTNSPESTDSAVTQAFFLQDWPEIMARIPNSRIIVATGEQKHHAKSFVIDGVLTGVSTYNADWISERVNSEIVTLEWSEEFAKDTVESYLRDIDDPQNESFEYKIRRDADGRALLRDGKPIVESGPEDHMPAEELQKSYGFLEKAVNAGRSILPALRPLKHRALDPATDFVREID